MRLLYNALPFVQLVCSILVVQLHDSYSATMNPQGWAVHWQAARSGRSWPTATTGQRSRHHWHPSARAGSRPGRRPASQKCAAHWVSCLITTNWFGRYSILQPCDVLTGGSRQASAGRLKQVLCPCRASLYNDKSWPEPHSLMLFSGHRLPAHIILHVTHRRRRAGDGAGATRVRGNADGIMRPQPPR